MPPLSPAHRPKKKAAELSSDGLTRSLWLAWLLLIPFFALSCGGGITSSQPNKPVVNNLSATPSTIDFGDVQVSDSSVLPSVVANTGKTSVTISNIAVTGSEFTVGAPTAPITLAAGQTVSLNAKFTPTATGTAEGTLSLASNSSDSPTVIQLHGNGYKKKHSVGLAWDPPPSAGQVTVNGYIIYRAEASSSGCDGVTYSPVGSTSGVASTTFTDRTVQGGYTYCYQVTAMLSGQESSPSNVVEATVPSP